MSWSIEVKSCIVPMHELDLMMYKPVTALLLSAGASLARVRQSREAKSSAEGLASNSTSTSSSRKPKKGSPAPSKPRPYKSLAAKQPGNGSGRE